MDRIHYAGAKVKAARFDADATHIANSVQPLAIEGLPLLPLYLVSNGERLMTLAKSSACLTCMRRGRVVGDW